jgi:hypothetical protein
MRTFELLIAVTPIAMYLVLVGLINLRRRPYVVTGARESMLVGLALSGLAIIGPMELFFPQQAANQFGAYVWLLLVAFYGMLLLLWILVARPRLVVYNISSTQVRAVLSEAALKLDSDARWAGDCLALPRLNVQLHVESFETMRNVTLIGAGNDQSYTNWRRLEGSLRGAIKEITVPRNPRGYSFLIVGLLLMAGLTFQAVQNPQAIAQGLFQLLRL